MFRCRCRPLRYKTWSVMVFSREGERAEGEEGNLLQKPLKIRAAFSHSLSIDSGRKPSEPSLWARAFTGPETLLVKAAPRADSLLGFFLAAASASLSCHLGGCSSVGVAL